MVTNRCMKCMREYEAGEKTCPVCGNVHGQEEQPEFALRCGSILNGKYLIGKTIGQGGFGITYVGWDLLLDRKVAVKEYFPVSMSAVTRDGRVTNVVTWTSVGTADSRQAGFESFLKEARKMAKLDDIPGIVGVRDLFTENETAYIVMNFIEGETLKEKLQKNGIMSFADCVETLAPVMKSLERVHQQNLIHRDISPDNIMIDPQGEAWLLDLGAAKDLAVGSAVGQHSQLVAKHGFSPPEQYMQGDRIGPWSDVYAMAATVYYCTTGKIPPAAPDRTFRDELAIHPPLKENEFAVIRAGMAFDPEKRTRNMAELLKQFRAAAGGRNPGRAKKVRKIIIAAVLAVVLAAVGIFAVSTYTKESPEPAPIRFYQMKDLPRKFEFQPTDLVWGQEQYRRSQVKSVEFRNTLDEVPETAWDMSQAEDGSIMAWMDGGKLVVASNGIVELPPEPIGMFQGFNNVVSIDFAGCISTSGVTSMQDMFSKCAKLETVDVSDWDTGNVRSMTSMFVGCFALKELDVSGWDTSSTEAMNWMFGDCAMLTTLDVSGWDTSRVGDMDCMFMRCKKLRQLDLSNWKTYNLNRMYQMFKGCSSLPEITCSDQRILKEFDKR